MEPQEVTPFNESLPTPVKRLPHEGDARAGGGRRTIAGAPGTPPPMPARAHGGRGRPPVEPPWHRGATGSGTGAPPKAPRDAAADAVSG